MCLPHGTIQIVPVGPHQPGIERGRQRRLLVLGRFLHLSILNYFPRTARHCRLCSSFLGRGSSAFRTLNSVANLSSYSFSESQLSSARRIKSVCSHSVNTY